MSLHKSVILKPHNIIIKGVSVYLIIKRYASIKYLNFLRLIVKIVQILLLLTLGLMAPPVSAKGSSEFNYVSVSYLNFSYDDVTFEQKINPAEIEELFSITSNSLSGYRMAFGHHFNQYLATEVGFSSLDAANYTLNEQSSNSEVATSTEVEPGEFKSLSADIRIITTYPITKNMYLKAHLAASLWNTSLTHFTLKNAQYDTVTKDLNGVSMSSGFGIGFAISRSVALTGDFESTEIADVRLETLAISALIRF